MENTKLNIEQVNVVSSSTILRVDYDHLMQTMKLYFRSGNSYEYVAVPYEIFLGFKEAESAGRFFHTNVKGKYDFFTK